MSRRPPSLGAARWGVAVIVAGAGAFAVLEPIAVTRSIPGDPQPVLSDAGVADAPLAVPSPTPPAPDLASEVPLTVTSPSSAAPETTAPRTSASRVVVRAGTQAAHTAPRTTL